MLGLDHAILSWRHANHMFGVLDLRYGRGVAAVTMIVYVCYRIECMEYIVSIARCTRTHTCGYLLENRFRSGNIKNSNRSFVFDNIIGLCVYVCMGFLAINRHVIRSLCDESSLSKTLVMFLLKQTLLKRNMY